MSPTTSTAYPGNPANWMADHLDTLGAKPLKQLTLPASHDSGMYLSTFPQSLAQTQNLTIYNQLANGIRYFDLRPKWNGSTFVISHGPIDGPNMNDVLDDVRRFMNEGHRELVILKFSHFDGITKETYPKMIADIQKQLSPWLYTSLPKGKRLADITLNEYLAHSGTVLITCDEQFPIDHPSHGIWIYRDWDSSDPEKGDLRVYDQYSDTTSYQAMKSDQFRKFDDYNGKCKNRTDVPCDLFLLSWTLTPVTDVPAYAKTPNQHLAEAIGELKMPNCFGCRINMLYVDCVETAHVTDIAISVNKNFSHRWGTDEHR